MKAMKWKKLGDFDPPFETKLIIGFADGDFEQAYLDEIVTRNYQTVYKFKKGEDVYEKATHYFIPEPPKENP